MTRIKLQYIHEFRDRHGKARYYFRRPGFKRIALKGAPGSAEFMDAYRAALAGDTAPPVEIGAARTMPGTIAALTVAYYNSATFHALAPATRTTYRGIIDRFRVEHGDKRVATLKREHVARILETKAATPAAANNWLRVVRLLMDVAIGLRMRDDNPVIGVKAIKRKSTGFHTWTEDEIALFEAKHPIGTRARLALALLLYTAQRRSDVILMGRQHVSNAVLHVKQQKTGVEVDIPLHSDLVAILDATPASNMTYITTAAGAPFTPAGFTNWFRACCGEAGLPKGCSPHGLRKAASRRLAEHGCSAHEIMSITGHKTLKEVERYTAAVDRKLLAKRAMARTSSGKP